MGADISLSYIVITALLTSIVLGTMIGNFFVILAILVDKNLQTSGNQLVLSLAVADLMVACLVMPLGAYNDIHQGWYLSTEICEFWTSADVLCCTVTNVDYIYRRTKERVNLMILCVWTVGTVVSVAPILGWKDPEFGRRVLVDHKCMVSQDVAYQIFATISTFYAPLVLLLALYWRIFQVARKRIHKKPGEVSGVQSQARDKLETHASSLSPTTCKGQLRKQVVVQQDKEEKERQLEGEMKKDFSLSTSTNPAISLGPFVSQPLPLLKEEESSRTRNRDKISALVSAAKDLEQQPLTGKSRGAKHEQPGRASGCGKKRNEATDTTNKWASARSLQTTANRDTSTRRTQPADQVNCRKGNRLQRGGGHFTVERRMSQVCAKEASIDEFIDAHDEDEDEDDCGKDQKSEKYPKLKLAHPIELLVVDEQGGARRIGEGEGEVKMDYNKSNESQRGAQVSGTKSDAGEKVSSVAIVAIGARGCGGRGRKVAPIEDERGTGKASSWLQMSPAVPSTGESESEREREVERVLYSGDAVTASTQELAGQASSCCCCACDICLEACTSCLKEVSAFKQQELTGSSEIAARAEINHGAHTKYARSTSEEREVGAELATGTVDKVAHLSAHSNGSVAGAVESSGYDESAEEKVGCDEDFLSSSSSGGGTSSSMRNSQDDFDCLDDEARNYQHPLSVCSSQQLNNNQQSARFKRTEMSSFEQHKEYEDEESSLSTAFPLPLIKQTRLEQSHSSQVKDPHLELAEEGEVAELHNNNGNISNNTVNRSSSNNKSARSLDLRRKFRALGQIVSFVQTSKNFSYSSESIDQHELTGTSASASAAASLREPPTQIEANSGPSSGIQQDARLLHKNESEFRDVPPRGQRDSGTADSARQPRVSHTHRKPSIPMGGPNGSSITGASVKQQAQQPHQHLHLHQHQHQRRTRPDMEMRREKKAAKTLAIITGVFVCCWLPFFLNAIIMPICGPSCTPSDLILSILLWLGYLNSLLNPIIYTIFSPDFRRAFRRLLCWPRLPLLTETLKSGKG